MVALPAAAVDPGTVITNVAFGTYDIGSQSDVPIASNPVVLITASPALPPDSVVFDAQDGSLVSGATITLVDDATGLPATVVGDDGVSVFPNPIVSGATVKDGSGKVYAFGPGRYRFPVITPGNYRLAVEPPDEYVFPTVKTDGALQSLPGGPWSLNTAGSRGTAFSVPTTHFDVDLPLDHKTIIVQKTGDKTIVSKGDFIEYSITINNTKMAADIDHAVLTDYLPAGLRYIKGSAVRDGKRLADPVISGNGMTLKWDLGTISAGASTNIRYVAQVAASAKPGQVVNRAVVNSRGGVRSNLAAYAVMVTEELFTEKNILVGRVMIGGCSAPAGMIPQGLQNARIYLENGTYVQTDEEGKWHMDGLNPGTHVVQLDNFSLPDEYEAFACEDNTAYAGTPFSQFVDLKPGTLWRVDFHVRPKPPRSGNVVQKVTMTPVGDKLAVQIALSGDDVPLNRLRSMTNVPDGWQLDESSLTMDGQHTVDHQVVNNTLIVNLPDKQRAWQHDLRFSLQRQTDVAAPADAELKVTGMFVNNTEPKGRLPLLKLPVAAAGSAAAAQSADSQTPVTATWEKQSAAINAGTKEVRREESDKYDENWLATAGDGIELLYPSEVYNPAIPAIRVGVKHPVGYKVSLTMNGKPVSELNFFGMIKNNAGTMAISRWRGVDIAERDNLLEVTVKDAAGAVARTIQRKIHYSGLPATAELLPEKSTLVADGKNNPVVAIRFRDAAGYPARYGVTGAYTVNAPYRAKGDDRNKADKALLNSDNDNRQKFEVRNDGIAYIQLEPTLESGEALLSFRFNGGQQDVRAWLSPSQREWILVGLAEDAVSEHMESGDQAGLLNSEHADDVLTDGRAAFFAKGTIKGSWLLTMAYDSSASNDGPTRDKEKEQRFKDVIDPDEYYTLYGDNTQQQYDAATSKKLYVKIAKDRFYSLFGDFETGLTVTELGRYSRSMTGYKTEYKGDKVELNAFVAEAAGDYQRDEIRGDGTSGMYHLGSGKILPNTEKVTIEVRDRYRSEVIVSSESKQRNLDYNIDYNNGTIWFRAPVPVHDEKFNPVYIVVEYESETMGDNGQVAGGRVAYKPDGKTEIGTTVVNESGTTNEGELVTVDVTRKITDHLELKLEQGQSRGVEDGVQKDDSAHLAELTYRTDHQETSVYNRDIGEDYGLGEQRATETGMRKSGVESKIDLGNNLKLDTDAYRQQNTETGDHRTLGESKLEFVQDTWSVYGGLRTAEDIVDDSAFSANQLLLGGTLSPAGSKFRFFNNTDILLDGSNNTEKTKASDYKGISDENSDFPNLTAFGAEYELNEKIDLLAQQEYTWGDYKDTTTTMGGIRNKPWTGAETISTVQRQITPTDQERVFSTLGLLQNFTWGSGWRSDFSFDRSATISGDQFKVDRAQRSRFESPRVNSLVPDAVGGDEGEDYYAVSGGLGYLAHSYEWTSRAEYRDSDSELKRNFDVGYHRDIASGVAQTVGVLYTHELTRDTNVALDTVDARISTGWRPLDSDWIVLQRIDLVFEEDSGKLLDRMTRKIIQNTHANYKPDMFNQYSFQYSAKYVMEALDDADYTGYTDYTGLEYRRFLGKQWDVGVQGGWLHNWEVDNMEYMAGLSLGYSPIKNTWVSVGYNFFGFRDEDFANADYTDKGLYLKFRIKFDQESLRNLVKKF